MGVPFNFVSAADGTNVVKIFRDALTLAAEYKKNPPKDDFMADVMDLLGEFFQMREIGFHRLDGTVPKEERERMISE